MAGTQEKAGIGLKSNHVPNTSLISIRHQSGFKSKSVEVYSENQLYPENVIFASVLVPGWIPYGLKEIGHTLVSSLPENKTDRK